MGIRQGEVADKIGTWVGRPTTWRAFSRSECGAEGSLMHYWRKKTFLSIQEIPEPANNQDQIMLSCWEMPIFAAIKTNGAVSETQIDTMMLAIASDKPPASKAAPLYTNRFLKKYYGVFGSGAFADKPIKGDLVFFMAGSEELAHVVVATGNSVGGHTQVYSLWSTTSRTGPVQASVEVTTVEALETLMLTSFGSRASVYAGSPVW